MKVAIASIIVGERRRQDHGDIAGLAESIARYGLLHPIVIDESSNLVAGGRRLMACQHLALQEVEVRRLGDLSDAELREIEIEENLQRKDLTSFEVARQLLRKVPAVAPVISSKLEEKDGRGRKATHGAPKSDIAQALGVGVAELVRAEQHVAAVEAHPQLAEEPQSVAIDYAKAVAEQPELVDSPEPPRQIAEAGRRQRKAKNLKAAADLRDALETAGADGRVARRAARAKVMQCLREASVLADLDAEWSASALDRTDELEVRTFMARMRAWLDRMEAAMPRPMNVLQGGKQS
jgi:ParB-like chromosome segregation protein Spo0J